MKIVISSGHGSKISGAIGPQPWGLHEHEEAVRVVNQTAIELRKLGVDVITFEDTVSDDQDENLERICDFHNVQGAHDYDISVHFNDTGSGATESPVGCEVFYQSQAGFDLADEVVGEICIASGLIDRGAKEGNLYFLSHTNQVANLIEVCFVNSHADVNIYHAKFDAICSAIAAGLAGRDGVLRPPVDLPEPEPEPPSKPSGKPLRTLQKGDEGEDVANLQAVLGLIADGNFGEITETQVEAYQAACNLDADGVVGPETWSEVAALDVRLVTGSEGLSGKLAVSIIAAAEASSLVDYQWPDRGQSPPGYLSGVALSYAVAYQMLLERNPVAVVMSRQLEDDDIDALAWYEGELTEIGVELDSTVGRLRGLFVLLLGLGMRESSGRYCEGRDMSADNVESDTCEAGLFQTSWNISNASDLFDDLMHEYWQDPTGWLGVFREGISPTANNLDVYGTGTGARYQFLAKFCPLFACLTTALGLRVLRQHWGPINRREVDVQGAAEDLLYEVQLLVEADLSA